MPGSHFAYSDRYAGSGENANHFSHTDASLPSALWTRFHKFDAADPKWPDRDRFVLSAGHGSMLLYALLYLTGHDGMGIEEIKRFRQLHSPAAGHPEFGEHPAIETTTGPLGQGISTAVGMAPGILIMATLGSSIADLLRHPNWTGVGIIAGVIAVGAAGTFGIFTSAQPSIRR